MSVWEKVFKNPKAKGTLALASNSLSVPGIKLPKRAGQMPSLIIGLAFGTTYTKRTFLCQLGSELVRWNPDNGGGKNDFSVFRLEKILSDDIQSVSLGDESFSNFMSDRSEPACTLFLQPIRFLISNTKPPSFVSTHEGEKVIHQSPTNQELFKAYVKGHLKFIQDTAKSLHTQIPRFHIGQIVVEYPDYFAAPDVKKFRQWLVEAAQEFFPPILSEEEDTELSERFTLLPESVVTTLHWLTDHVEPKLAIQELDLKKMMVRHGILPRTSDPINFLVVTMGATHSRVVRIKASSFAHLISAKRVGETVPLAHTYLGRTGFGGDHISCTFLEEEEEKRYGGTPANRVSTLTRKVFEDWGRMNSNEGKKHFEEIYGDQFQKAMEKLLELTLKGFGESPENTIIILGGKSFEMSYFKDFFRNALLQHRVPQARIVSPNAGECGIEKVCEIIQFHQKGLGRSFSIKGGLDTEGSQKFTWKMGKIVEGTLVETILSPDNKEWDTEHPREFTVNFEKGVRRLNLGYQKTMGGLSQLWANVNLKSRVISTIKVTFRTEGPDDLKIIDVKVEGGKAEISHEDFQIEMLLAGEHPSYFPLYEKILKTS